MKNVIKLISLLILTLASLNCSRMRAKANSVGVSPKLSDYENVEFIKDEVRTGTDWLGLVSKKKYEYLSNRISIEIKDMSLEQALGRLNKALKGKMAYRIEEGKFQRIKQLTVINSYADSALMRIAILSNATVEIDKEAIILKPVKSAP
jgi:hypothetical protein